jgi:prepilin-type N-terminal cleavage/methylation domain-containing protein
MFLIRTNASRSQRGLTLAEMLLALAVGSIVMAALLGFSLYASKCFAAMTNYVDLEQKSQSALDNMTREIRETKMVTGFGTMSWNGRTITNSISFVDSDDLPLTYTYTNEVLLRDKNGAVSMLLTNCDYLNFQLFLRNPLGNGTTEQFAITQTTNTKLISVSWICSRTILGSRLNTESVQTAKIVIRKENTL